MTTQLQGAGECKGHLRGGRYEECFRFDCWTREEPNPEPRREGGWPYRDTEAELNKAAEAYRRTVDRYWCYPDSRLVIAQTMEEAHKRLGMGPHSEPRHPYFYEFLKAM